MKKGAKRIVPVVLVALLILAGIGVYVFFRFMAPSINTKSDKGKYLYVYPNSTWNQVIDSLVDNTDVKHAGDLGMMLNKFGSIETPKTGAYLIEPNSSVVDLYKKLGRGHQSPIKLVIQPMRLPGDMAKFLAKMTMPDSAEIARAMTDPKLIDTLDPRDSTFAYYIVPNTYEVYWGQSATELIYRLKKESDVFWDSERKAKADSLGISVRDVITIASIVEEESNKVDEYPLIAGLYLNRLHIGMALQADPTVKYAVGDFSIKRITGEHLSVDSPYNTYKYPGLPPTPIRIPSTAAIDGVLNARQHDYKYMCARSDFSGYHDFAVTFAEHQKNAAAYARALNARGIK